MPDAVVHIGLPKTGTSAIQSWLRVNARFLRERGVFFDGFGNRLTTPVQHELGFGLLAIEACDRPLPSAEIQRRAQIRNRDDQRRVADAFSKRFSESVRDAQSRTYVISSEWLSGWLTTSDMIHAFDQEMQGYFSEIVYVVYLRDQIDWIASSYGQRIRHGASLTLRDFIETQAQRNYHHLCLLWSEATNGRLNIRLLERDFLPQGDLLADFAKVLNVNPDGLGSPQRDNAALSASSIRLWRSMNAAGRRIGCAAAVQKLRSAYCNSRFGTIGRKLELSSDQIRHIAQVNAASNETLRAKWFPYRPILFQHAHRALSKTSAANTAMNSQRRNA